VPQLPIVVLLVCGCGSGQKQVLPPPADDRTTHPPIEPEITVPYDTDPILLQLPMEVLWFDQNVPDIEEQGRVILADGRPAGLDLRDMAAPDAASTLSQNGQAASSLAIDPATLCTGEVRQVLAKRDLASLALSLTGEGLEEADLASCLSGLAETVLIKLDEASNETLEQISSIPHVRALIASNTDIDDAGLEHVSGMMDLELLDIYSTAVTDEGVALISGLTGLRVLNLGSTDISGACIRHLRDMQALRVLDLTSIEADTDGLEDLVHLPALASLNLYGSGVTDADIAHLEGMTRMVHLDLTSTAITNAALSSIGTLACLEYLDLHETQITDRGLAHLSSLTALRSLGLSQTSITDKGLVHLYGLDRLEFLYLVDTEVTENGIEDLLEEIDAFIDGP
jgi:hypothetical protein